MFFRFGTIQFPPKSRLRRRDGGRRAPARIGLDLARDAHARAAMEAYADSCEPDMPWLGEVLRESRYGRPEYLTRCARTVLRVFALAQEKAAGRPDYAHAAWEHVRLHLAAVLEAPPDEPEEDDAPDDAIEPADGALPSVAAQWRR